MANNRLSNARVLDWLSRPLDECSEALDCAKVQVNSAAVWWFCTRLSADERATILGEFVKQNALRGQAAVDGKHQAVDGKPHRARSGRKTKPAE